MIKYTKIAVGSMQVNCYIVYDSETMCGIVIDPGADIDRILHEIDDLHINIQAVVLTHGHFDHALDADTLRKTLNVPLFIHEQEKDILESSEMNLSDIFMGVGNGFSFAADVLLKDGDKVNFGNESLCVIHTPGHTKGSISLYADGVLFSGDTLFCGTYGRIDFPTGNGSVLAASIKKLYELPDETVVNPGHNSSTTIGKEKATNFAVKILLENAPW